MRGADCQTAAMFSYISPEGLVPKNHPLRAIRPLVNAALQRLSPQFGKIYAPSGRDFISPERLLRALLLQALFSVRSERQLMEQITYNMMFRWFVGLSMDAAVWDVTVFTKNRERLLQGDIARGFLAAILVNPQVKPLLSGEHFAVDGTVWRRKEHVGRAQMPQHCKDDRLAAIRRPRRIDLLAHVAPLGWEHIALTGDYVWARSDQSATFRPLRDVRSTFQAIAA